MRELASLYAASVTDPEAKFRMAQLLSAHNEGVFWNDRLWNGLQRYAFESLAAERSTRAVSCGRLT